MSNEHVPSLETKTPESIIKIGTVAIILYNGDELKEAVTIQLVDMHGKGASDPVAQKISTESPLGRAIEGKKVGSRVPFETPSGVEAVKIIAIPATDLD